MHPRDLFGVFLRGFGVYLLSQGAYYAFFVFIKTANVLTSSLVPVSEDKLLVGYFLAAGLLVIVLADRIVDLIYGPQSKTDPADSSDSAPIDE